MITKSGAEAEALVKTAEQGPTVQAPQVGEWLCLVERSSYVGPGQLLGYLTRLGQSYRVVLGTNAPKAYVENILIAKGAVEYGQELLRLTQRAEGFGAAAEASLETAEASSALFVRAPQPGRAYLSPEPGKPAYVKVGDEIVTGQVLVLIEVMKTFTPMQYAGPAEGLPAKARVMKVLLADSDEIEDGQPLFEIEAVD